MTYKSMAAASPNNMATNLPLFRPFLPISRTFCRITKENVKSKCTCGTIIVPSLYLSRKYSDKRKHVKAPGQGEHRHHHPRHDNWAKDLIYSLDAGQRRLLMAELAAFEKTKIPHLQDMEPVVIPKVSFLQKRQLAIFCGLPFVGFGTLDNVIMITAGEYIDTTFGAFLGISTMAAAALGNMVSDVAGIGSAGYVEQFASKVGILPPDLMPEQVDLQSTRFISALGRMIGVAIGCTIGMMPLLFIKREEEDEDEEESSESDEKDSSEIRQKDTKQETKTGQ